MVDVELLGIRLDAHDVRRISTFWSQLLGWRAEDRAPGVVAVVPDVPSGYPLLVHRAETPKKGQNRIHLDLTTTSSEHLQQLIARAHDLGADDVDIGQTPDDHHTVLVDPEGNELCIIAPGSVFLADTGPVGAINCDGSRAVGLFWSRALGWPLVWDQDEETAIQAPAGGSKITWSGPPLMPSPGRDRFRLELATSGPLTSAVHRLTSLGARVGARSSSTEVVLEDPDGHEFQVVSRR